MGQPDEILAAFIDGNAQTSAAAIRDAADSLSTDDLARLAEMEAAGGNRKTVLRVIDEMRSNQSAAEQVVEPVEPTLEPEPDPADDEPSEEVDSDPTPAADETAIGPEVGLASPAGEEPKPVEQVAKPVKALRGEELPDWLTDPDYTGPLTIDRVEARRKYQMEHK